MPFIEPIAQRDERRLTGSRETDLSGRRWGAKQTFTEKDRGKRFALWSFLHMFGSSPDLDVAFEDEQDREAARNFMDLLAASQGEGTG